MDEKAFPQLYIESGERDGHGDLIEPITSSQGGLTKREWFAGIALQGLCAAYRMQDPKYRPEDFSKLAYEMADEMLNEGGE